MFRTRTGRTLASVGLLAFFSLGAARTDRSSCLVSPMSMYVAGEWLFVSDEGSGIHVYAAARGSAPAYQGTIPLSGNSGVAVRDSVIYANSYGSILALRLNADCTADTLAIVYEAPYCCTMPIDYIDEQYHSGWGCACSRAVEYDAVPLSSGTGSSYAVFAVIDTFLYYVDGMSLVSMSVAVPESPRLLSTTYLSWDLETLFPTEDYLFVGAATGMYILNRRQYPATPTLISTFVHARACDPVVVQDTIAYLTLRSGTACGAFENALIAVSIADPSSPYELGRTIPNQPYGLAVQDTLCYVGLGHSGYSLYDVTRPDSLLHVATWSTPATKDFIWDSTQLYLMGFSQIAAYDVSDPANPVRLGVVQ